MRDTEAVQHPAAGARQRRWASALAFAFCVVLLMPVIAAASDKELDDALIYGTVWGPDDRGVPGVQVKIQREGDKKPKWERVSDRRGEFAVRVPKGKGTYIVFAEIKTKQGKKRIETKAEVEWTERVDVSLRMPE